MTRKTALPEYYLKSFGNLYVYIVTSNI